MCHASGHRKVTTRLRAISYIHMVKSFHTQNQIFHEVLSRSLRESKLQFVVETIFNKKLVGNRVDLIRCDTGGENALRKQPGEHLADAVEREANRYRGSFPPSFLLLTSRFGVTGPEMQAFHEELAIKRVEDTIQRRVPASSGGGDRNSASPAAVFFRLTTGTVISHAISLETGITLAGR